MTQGKGKRDEKLIEELYEKLYWYTYEASEEEFDDKEVDAIVRLLDVLDPKEVIRSFPRIRGRRLIGLRAGMGWRRSLRRRTRKTKRRRPVAAWVWRRPQMQM